MKDRDKVNDRARVETRFKVLHSGVVLTFPVLTGNRIVRTFLPTSLLCRLTSAFILSLTGRLLLPRLRLLTCEDRDPCTTLC